MIDKSFNFLLAELNTHLGTVFASAEAHAVLSSLAMPDGTVPAGIENKIVITIANIERETTAINHTRTRPEGGLNMRLTEQLNLNVYFLLSASFAGDYVEALRFLSTSMGFLQSKPAFTPQNSANFPRGLEALTVELVNLDIHNLQNLWASTGAKYLPSAYYKARMLTLRDGWVAERIPVVTGTDARV